MTRPTTLTVALSSVLAAAIDNAGRPGLLATLHPELGQTLPRPRAATESDLAQVFTMPRVIPMPRQDSTPVEPTPDPPSTPTPPAA